MSERERRRCPTAAGGTASSRTGRRARCRRETMSFLRSTRSTSTPAKGPNRTDGQQPGEHHAGHGQAARDATAAARRHERGDGDEPDPVAQRRDEHGAPRAARTRVGRKRSFSVAGLVPRRAAISSARLATRSVSSGAVRFARGLTRPPDPFALGARSGSRRRVRTCAPRAARASEPTFTSTPSCTTPSRRRHTWPCPGPGRRPGRRSAGRGPAAASEFTAKSQSGYRSHE